MILSVLEAIQSGGGRAKPTHVLYKANLSHKLMKRYIKELKDRGFVVEEDDKSIMLTDDGKKFLSELRKMKRFMESFGL